MGNRISVHGLKKNFGKLEVLEDISIKVREGEAVCMVGLSGSDKSMFLQCLNRLEKITPSHVVVDGHPISDSNTNINKVRENIGVMLQHFNLSPHLTAKESITLAPTKLELMGREEAGREALGLLARVGLVDKTEAYPGQFPDGQKQRVATTRSLIMNPGIVLSDGPTSTLDPEMMDEVLEVMKQLIVDGMITVVVTHEIGFTREAADRVVFTDEGRIVEKGTPDEVFGNPREERTRSLLDRVLQILGFLGG